MFTIIICTYNGERTLKRVIQKILDQDDYDQFISQFIVVDNASTDATKAIVEAFSNDHRITYSYEAKPGLAYARLNAVNITTGDWIVFVDDDNELASNWVKTAAKYIKDNPEIGIFGGAIVPKLDFKPTDEEYERLVHCKHMLACTDLKKEDIDISRKKSPMDMVIGAGMVVKTEYMKELANRGWIKQIGRTKDNTASGDDAAIFFFVTRDKKKQYGHCPLMLIEHNLARFRLQEDYLIKLNNSLTENGYTHMYTQNWLFLRKIKRLLWCIIKQNPYPEESFQSQLFLQRKKIIWNMLKKDFFAKN